MIDMIEQRLLRSPTRRLYLVKCLIRPYRIEAGWVYVEPGLKEVEMVRDADGNQYLIGIPPEVRELKTFAALSHASEVIEFPRVTEPV